MLRRPSTLSSFTLLAAIAAPATAQETAPNTVATLEKQVDTLRGQVSDMSAKLKELEALIAQLRAAPASPFPAPATTTPTTSLPKPAAVGVPSVQSASRTPVLISGLFQVQGNAYFNQDNVPAGTARLADGGRLRRGQLRFNLPAITPRVNGMVMFDLAKTNNLTRTGSQLMDLVIGYRVDTNKLHPKLIEVGQYKLGFGYEGDLVGSVDLELIERAQIYSFRDLAVVAGPSQLPGLTGGGLGNTRDVGVRLSGALTKQRLNYNLGLFDGLGEGQNDASRGDTKAVIGRVFYGHRDSRNIVRGNMLGLSAMTADSRNVNANGPLDRHGYNLFAGHLRDPEVHKWSDDRLTVFGEYSVLKSKIAPQPTLFKNGIGYYGSVGYLLHPHVELVSRYDTLRQEVTAGNGTSTEISAGLNYYFRDYRDQGPKIMVNLVKVNGEPNALTTFDSFQLRTQYQLAF